jgi:hypothetical protein
MSVFVLGLAAAKRGRVELEYEHENERLRDSVQVGGVDW